MLGYLGYTVNLSMWKAVRINGLLLLNVEFLRRHVSFESEVGNSDQSGAHGVS